MSGVMEEDQNGDELLKRSFCVEFTHFPDVDEAWLDERAIAVGEAIRERLIHKLEWGRVYALIDRDGIGLVFLIARGFEDDLTITQTFIDIVCEKTGIVLGKPGSKTKARREGGMPQIGLGPRFPAEFFETRGRIGPVS